MSRRDTTLYRDTEDQKVAGVCAALARYFDVDPVLVRVLFVVTVFVGGGSLLAYALLWWLLDPAPAGHWADQSAGTEFAPPATGAPVDSGDDTHPDAQAA